MTSHVAESGVAIGTECEAAGHTLGINVVKTILLHAILWLKVHYWLTENTAIATMDIKYIPFLQPNIDNIFMASAKVA